jgi:hypothetical protein
MHAKFLSACLLLLLTGACATVCVDGGAAQYSAFGDKLQSAVTTYRSLEPRLTEDQKNEFAEAYGQVCKAYQTAGILLGAILKAADQESANTAELSYRRTMTELPDLVDRVTRLVKGFEEGKQHPAP